MMKFSVVVPVYNVERYLAQCIESVLAQTYQDFELILVDDGSKDRSGAICDEYAQKFTCVQSFHKANSGQNETRFWGVEKSSGDYVVFLDSDDLLAPYALETIFNKFIQYNCDMVVFKWERFEDKPNILPLEDTSNFDVLIDNRKGLFLKILSNTLYNSVCLKAVKRRYLRLPEISLRHAEDLLLTIEMVMQNPKALFIDNVLYYYRINPTSVTHALNIEKFIDDVLYVRSFVRESMDKISTDFTEKDLIEYRKKEVEVVASLITTIFRRTNKAWKYKVELLEKIRNSSFFNGIINGGWRKVKTKNCNRKTKIIWFLYNRKMYRTLQVFMALCLAIKNVKIR